MNREDIFYKTFIVQFAFFGYYSNDLGKEVIPMPKFDPSAINILCASGALGFDGRGWWWERVLVWLGILQPELFEPVEIKTLTRHPRRGNLRMWWPFGCIRIFRCHGEWVVVNAVGLTNRGIEWWIKRVYPAIAKRRQNVIVSIYAETPKEGAEMAAMLEPLEFVVGIENNVSCPNTGERLDQIELTVATARAVKRNAPSKMLIAKFGYTQPFIKLIRELFFVIDGAHLINTVPWEVVFPEKRSPLAHLGGGGVSGRIIFPFLEQSIVGLMDEFRSMPIIDGGGMDFERVKYLQERYRIRSFSFGTDFMLTPWRVTKIARQCKELLAVPKNICCGP